MSRNKFYTDRALPWRVEMQSLDDNEIVEVCAFLSKADAEAYKLRLAAEAEGTHMVWVKERR